MGENSLILAFLRFWDGVEVMRLRAAGTLPIPCWAVRHGQRGRCPSHELGSGDAAPPGWGFFGVNASVCRDQMEGGNL